MKKKENDKSVFNSITKDNFIEFLANATPDEINQYIREKGKPRKLVEPMIFFKDKQPLSHNE